MRFFTRLFHYFSRFVGAMLGLFLGGYLGVHVGLLCIGPCLGPNPGLDEAMGGGGNMHGNLALVYIPVGSILGVYFGTRLFETIANKFAPDIT